MSDRPSHNLGGLDIDLARRIDEVCRRFEADWREGRQPRIDDYLVDVSRRGPARTAGRAGGPGARAAPVGGDRRTRRGRPCHGSRAPDGCRILHDRRGADHRPGTAAHVPDPGRGDPSVHEEATLPPQRPATVDLDQPTARLGSSTADAGASNPPASATSATTRSSARSPAAAWASSSRPGRSASTAPSRSR